MTGATESEDHAGVPFPPPLVYVIGLVAGTVLHQAVDGGEPATWVRIAGAVAGVLAFLALDSGAMQRFRAARTSVVPWRPSSALVQTGPYRLTRNPMYVGMACLYVGLAFALGVLWALVLLPVVLVIVDRVAIAREEPYLERRFGSEYLDYKGRVRRWL